MKSDKNYCRSLFAAACLASLLSCENGAWSEYEKIVPEEDAYHSDSLILSLNELLFDPVGDGVDYVEVVNVSDIELDLSCYFLHSRNSKGELSKGYAFSDSVCLLPPGGYCLLTSDTASVSASYGFSSDGIWLQIKGFPSMPNAGGTIVITDTAGCIADECSYLPAMHHPLLTDREGVALEKLNPTLSSSEASSWASAAADVSYGTPGRPNSQYRQYIGRCLSGGFSLPRSWFCPSSDDSTAFLMLVYDNVYAYKPIVTIEVYSRYGEKVATLADNAIMGVNGIYLWYGQDDKGAILPHGHYIIRTQVVSLSGQVVFSQFNCENTTFLYICRSYGRVGTENGLYIR